MSSDIIQELSFVGNLTIGETYTTPKIIAGQYTSLSVSFSGAQDCIVTIQFSPDGTNWDISINHHMAGGINSYENIVILSKWIRIRTQNVGIANLVGVRVYTYGAIENTTLTALIGKIAGKSPEVSIDNAPTESYGAAIVTNLIPFPNMQYSFNLLWDTTIPIGLGNPDLRRTPYYQTLGATTTINSSASTQDNMFSLCGMSGSIGDFESVIGDEVLPYRPGQSMVIRFSARFTSLLAGKYTMQIGLGLKEDKALINILCGVFVGWDVTNQLFCSYVYDTVETKVLQSNFNFDKVDGSGNSQFLLVPSNLNIFQIKYSYLGATNIQFQVFNPADHSWITMHVVRIANKQSLAGISNANGSFLMQVIKETAENHYADYQYSLSTASFGCFLTDEISYHSGHSLSNNLLITVTTEVPLILMRNEPVWAGNKYVPYPIMLKDVTGGSSRIGGGDPGILNFKFYIRPTYSSPPAWVFINPYESPMQVGTGFVLATVGKKYYELMTTEESHSMVLSDTLKLVLPPDNDYLITVTATQTGVRVALNINWFEFF